ncbi:hypothetical protein [Brachybacterium sp. UMB0905]|uniref:hypothetical protein n=1 Tax=Brachybacterium sp. UMB0905 TaxID=2069310 RepID=UPI000C80C23B|nr:hypothetical protein [Brachybacterium sp. UMB0905]PMC74583.1 hypothetical protein CJ197_12840 [Brachybacterium sp. UMB0905]
MVSALWALVIVPVALGMLSIGAAGLLDTVRMALFEKRAPLMIGPGLIEAGVLVVIAAATRWSPGSLASPGVLLLFSPLVAMPTVGAAIAETVRNLLISSGADAALQGVPLTALLHTLDLLATGVGFAAGVVLVAHGTELRTVIRKADARQPTT